MALIACKYCGKQVSDKAKVCPHCGESLIEEATEETKEEVLICEECGSEIPEGSDTCPICGCPVPNVEVQEIVTEPSVQKVEISRVSITQSDSTKKLIKKIGIAVAALAVVVGVALGIKGAKAKKAKEEYYNNLVEATNQMYNGALLAEDAGGLIHDVWYNCIYEKSDSRTDKYTKRNSYSYYDDFNTALANLFADSSFTAQTSLIRSNQDTITGLMKALKNPPEEYRDAYDDIKDLYDAYLAITECAVNPSGNLTSYTSTFNQADGDFVKYYKVMKSYFE